MRPALLSENTRDKKSVQGIHSVLKPNRGAGIPSPQPDRMYNSYFTLS